jgi:hypothetical protein
MSRWSSFKETKVLFENFRKFVNEDVADAFVQASDASLPQYVGVLKKIAADPDFQALARAGLSDDAGKADEVVTVDRDSAAAQNLIPTQAEIGFSNSLADQLKNAYGATEAALGLKGTPIIMPSQDKPPPAILVWNGKYILDGHHRWSQVMMTNPTGDVAIDSMTGPVLDSAEDALKMTQLAIAINAKNVATKDFEGANLMDVSADEVYSFVYNNITDEVINLLWKAGKLKEKGGDPKQGSFVAEAAKRHGKRKAAAARMAAQYYVANLGTIQKRKGKFSRAGGMPQAGKSGTSQGAVNQALATGAVNYKDPSPEDVKE